MSYAIAPERRTHVSIRTRTPLDMETFSSSQTLAPQGSATSWEDLATQDLWCRTLQEYGLLPVYVKILKDFFGGQIPLHSILKALAAGQARESVTFPGFAADYCALIGASSHSGQ